MKRILKRNDGQEQDVDYKDNKICLVISADCSGGSSDSELKKKVNKLEQGEILQFYK